MREHWLQHAHGRIVAGDSEPDVLADYGWVQITDDEREALSLAYSRLTADSKYDKVTETLRNLLERTK